MTIRFTQEEVQGIVENYVEKKFGEGFEALITMDEQHNFVCELSDRLRQPVPMEVAKGRFSALKALIESKPD